MRAARWNTDAEIGGVWSVTVKRTAGGVVLPLAAPCTLALWAAGTDPVADAPVKVVTGVLAGDSKAATFALSVAEVTALGTGPREHRLILTDPVVGAQVMARGRMVIRGREGDL